MHRVHGTQQRFGYRLSGATGAALGEIAADRLEVRGDFAAQDLEHHRIYARSGESRNGRRIGVLGNGRRIGMDVERFGQFDRRFDDR